MKPVFHRVESLDWPKDPPRQSVLPPILRRSDRFWSAPNVSPLERDGKRERRGLRSFLDPRLFFWIGLIVSFFSIGSGRSIAGELPEFTGVRVGFDHHYKAGLWTPVELKIRGGNEPLSGTVSITVLDGDGIPTVIGTPSNEPYSLTPGEETTIRTCVRFGHVQSEMHAAFVVDGKNIAEKDFKTASQADNDHYLEAVEERPIYLLVGQTTLGLEDAVKLQASASGGSEGNTGRPLLAHIDEVDRLPLDEYAYEGVEIMIVSTSRPEMFQKLTSNDPRFTALDQWIRQGGRLLLFAGSKAKEVLAPNAPLANFAPGRFESMETLRKTAAWESFCGSSLPLPLPKDRDRIVLDCPRFHDPVGFVEAQEADLPLVIRSPRGLGQIVFVAADVDREPFERWNDRGLFLAKLLDFSLVHTEQSSEGLMSGGFGQDSDLSGQLRSSLDQYTNVSVIPFGLVAVVMIVYLALIGPGDYFFLKKVVRRPQWTWITFPTIVIVVSLLSYGFARSMKGNQLRVNQLDLIDVDVASKTLRGTAWMNLYSPRQETFDLALQPNDIAGLPAQSAHGYFAWLGLPGSRLGGMNSRGTGSSHWPRSYQLAFDTPLPPSDDRSMKGVPIHVGSSKSFTGRWQSELGLVPEAQLAEEQEVLTGTIANPFPFPLTNCFLAYDKWAIEVGNIEPKQTVSIGGHLRRSELRTYLTGWRMVKDAKDILRQQVTPYDSLSRDASYVLRAMLFYETAGGRNYTHLSNDYQSFLDFSELLRTGRAILVTGAIPSKEVSEAKQGATLLRDGKPLTGPDDRHEIMYRFVFPVRKK